MSTSAAGYPGGGGGGGGRSPGRSPPQPFPQTPQQQSPQQQSRLRETLSKIPLCTTLITVLCLILQLCCVFIPWELGRFTINPAAVVQGHEYYRLITSAYFHVNFFHIAMNMLSFVGIGAFLEMKMGTAYLFLTILWSTLLTNSLYIGLCYLITEITHDPSWLYYQSVGFSGVIFTLAVLESHSSPPNTYRSVFGMFNIPSRAYPWALLVIIQIMMPHISFIGHLSGLLIGIVQAYGGLNFLFPTAGMLNTFESSRFFSCVTRYDQYILCPDAGDHILPRGVNCFACLSRLGGGGGGSPRRFHGGGVLGTAASNSPSSSSLPTTVAPPPRATAATTAATTSSAASPTRSGGRGGWSRLDNNGGGGGIGEGEDDDGVEVGNVGNNSDSPRKIVL